MELGAKQVSLLRDGVEQQVPVETLVVGDHFVVRPGEKVATDGAGMLDPMVAGAAMAGSSLFVVGNSLRLRRFR